jgi:hypothetical protein
MLSSGADRTIWTGSGALINRAAGKTVVRLCDGRAESSNKLV